MKIKDISGQKFHQLTVISRVENTKHKKAQWSCFCNCGNSTVATTGSLVSGNTKSCGCRKHTTQKRFIDSRSVQHHARSYNTWTKMKFRCYDKSSPDYEAYGARGIKICADWLQFWSFFYDMGDPPTGHTIDRIDTNGDYEKSNCRWATAKQQARNTRSNVYVEVRGTRLLVVDAAVVLDMPASTLYAQASRFKKRNSGSSVEQVLRFT